MVMAKDIHGTVFRHGSAVMLARVVNSSAVAVTQASVVNASYTVFALTADDPVSLSPVEGHENIALDVEEVIFDVLETGPEWTADEVGYNFRHELDVSVDEAFDQAGRIYQVRYELQPVTGQKIVFRFLLKCI